MIYLYTWEAVEGAILVRLKSFKPARQGSDLICEKTFRLEGISGISRTDWS